LGCIGLRNRKMCEGQRRKGASIIERPRPRVLGYPVSPIYYRAAGSWLNLSIRQLRHF